MIPRIDIMRNIHRLFVLSVFCIFVLGLISISGQDRRNQNVRTVSIPISIFTKEELRQGQAEEFLQVELLTVTENQKDKQILSIRSVTDAPLSIAILIQDDLTSSFNLQLQDIRRFIRQLPKGSRVMVAYLRGGSLEVRQRFTTNLEAAAKSLRIVTSSSTSAPRTPYDGVIEALNRFDALPAGRRAILMVSDGLDLSQSSGGATPSESLDLDRAILQAQRKSVSVFPIYSPTVFTESGRGQRVLFGQGSLQKIADETGGRAFFQGTGAPLSFDRFFRELTILLNRQFLLTYLSDNMKKGYYKVEVKSTNPLVKIEHPRGYYYR